MIHTHPSSGFAPQEDPAINGFGETFTDKIGQSDVPVSVQRTLTLKVDQSSLNPVEVSFDSGLTWPMVVDQGEEKTWGVPDRLMTFQQMKFRGQRSNPADGVPATFDLHGS